MRKFNLIPWTAGIWGVLLVAWPRGANHELSTLWNTAPASPGEDLYKAPITQAPLGMLGVHFFESEGNRPRWDIRSRLGELHRQENYAYLQEVVANFMAEKTGNAIQTKSDYGRSQLDNQKVDLEGNVSIRSRRGYLFQMKQLSYDGKDHSFQTEEHVKMVGPIVERPTMILEGRGLVGNIDSEQFILKDQVTAQRRVKNNEWLRVSSQKGEFFTEDQRAIFAGKVLSMLPKLRMTSDVLHLNVGKEAESIEAEGNVTLHQRDRVGRAQRVSMEVGSTKVVLEGSAEVDSKGSRIRGKRITLDSEGDKFEVEGAEGEVIQ